MLVGKHTITLRFPTLAYLKVNCVLHDERFTSRSC